MTCDHEICNSLQKQMVHPFKGGAGCLIITKRQGKWVVLLGYEKNGTKNKNKLNLAAGGRSTIDDNCYIKCALRELKEEFKIDIPYEDFYKYFSDKENNKIYCHILGRATPVFIGVLPHIDIDALNKKIDYDNLYNNDPCQQEMKFVDFVDLSTREQISNKFPKTKVSSFAHTMISVALKNYNFL